VTSQGRLATLMLIGRHSIAAAAPWRISSWPFVVNDVFKPIEFTFTGSGVGLTTDFSLLIAECPRTDCNRLGDN
jgi:hypothetical protein